jgi:pyruvate dehydrogenase E2 component (dihydrolipoamide acetyltransferase)
MSESVSLPALGESVTEGTVTRWLKNVGDRVEVDEPLLEVSTDKVDTEIPSPVAGVIEAILVQEDETVEVGTALVTIGDGSGAGAAAPAAAPEATQGEQAAPAAAPEATQGEQAAPAAPPAPAPVEAPPAQAEAPAAPAAPAPQDFAPPAPAPAPAPAAEAPAAPQAAPAPEAPTAPQAAPAPQAPSAPQAAPAAEAPSVPQAAPAAPVAEVPPAAPAAPQAAPAPAPAPAAEPAAPTSGSHAGPAGYVTPIVRKLANEQGVDLASVTGTGVGGRIRKQDVISAHAAPAAAEAAPAPRQALETSPLRGTTVPMTRLRKVVAERAVVSMQSTAQLTTVVEVDVTRVARLRDKVKADFLAKTGNKLSFLPFFALATAEALKAYPIINSTVDGTNIVYPAQENMSIAVDTERGLLTPVIRDAGELDIAALAAQIADLADRTRNNQLKPDELSGGTFTLTNTGSRGALFDTPVVFLPQSAILGTGVVVKRPVVTSQDGSDAIAIRSMVYLALSYDHRIVDGADAARFLTAIKERLEEGSFEADLGI